MFLKKIDFEELYKQLRKNHGQISYLQDFFANGQAHSQLKIDIDYLCKLELVKKHFFENETPNIELIRSSIINALIKEIERLIKIFGGDITKYTGNTSGPHTKYYIETHKQQEKTAFLIANDLHKQTTIKLKSSSSENLENLHKGLATYIYSLYGEDYLDFLNSKSDPQESLHSLPEYKIIDLLKLISDTGDYRQENIVENMLNHKKARVRRMATTALGHLFEPINNSIIIKYLEQKLYDNDEDVRWRAAVELAKINNPKINQILENLAKTNPRKKSHSEIFTLDNLLLISVITLNNNYPVIQEKILPAIDQSKNPAEISILLNIARRSGNNDLIKKFLRHENEIIKEYAHNLLYRTEKSSSEEKSTYHISPSSQFSEKMRGVFLGMAIGDALGAPFEFMKKAEMKKYPNLGHLFNINLNRPINYGDYTDDTELTIRTMEEILKLKRFEPQQLALNLAEKIKNIDFGEATNTGYGHNTIRSGRQIYAGLYWKLLENNYDTCGGAMRIAPFAILYHKNEELLIENISQATLISHKNLHAVSGAIVVGLLQAELIKSTTSKLSLKTLEQITEKIKNIDQEMYEKLKLVIKTLKKSTNKADEIIGTSSKALEAIPYAIYCFYKYSYNFKAMMRIAVAVDGDSDSIAAMAGSFYGALHGKSGIPVDLIYLFPHARNFEQLFFRWENKLISLS